MSRLRAYHALLAVLVVAAYFSTEWGSAHVWLGYGVAAVIVLRLILALTGAPHLGLTRFYPHFQGLKLDNAFTHPAISRVLLVGIAACLIGVTGTGIAMDKGRAFTAASLANSSSVQTETPSAAVGEANEERNSGKERATRARQLDIPLVRKRPDGGCSVRWTTRLRSTGIKVYGTRE